MADTSSSAKQQQQQQQQEQKLSKKRKSSELGGGGEQDDKQSSDLASNSNSNTNNASTTTNGKKAPGPGTAATTTSNTKKSAASSTTATTTTTSQPPPPIDEKDETSSGNKSNEQVHENDYKPLSLRDIRTRLGQLCERVPVVPPQGLDAKNPTEIRQWASLLQAILEEFNLLVCCISTATYKWGTDRSGAADQHLALLSGELAASQDQISSTVTPRLTNVLAPVVDLVVDRVITTRTNAPANSSSLLLGATATTTTTTATTTTLASLESSSTKQEAPKSEKSIKGYDDSTINDTNQEFATTALSNDSVLVEVRQNVFDRKYVDEDFLHLCHTILCRNAPLLRQVVLANFYKLQQCLADYLDATQKDSYVESSRGFAY